MADRDKSSISDLLRAIETGIKALDNVSMAPDERLMLVCVLSDALKKIVHDGLFESIDKNDNPDANFYVEKIIKPAEGLLHNSLAIISSLLEKENSGFDKFHASMNLATRDAFVAAVNLLDFDDPSWPLFKRGYLDLGLSITVSDKYIVYGYDTFGGDRLEGELNIFPRRSNT